MTEYQYKSKSTDDTWQLGQILGGTLHPGSVILLSGELGAGKTLFSQGVGKGLGVQEQITSPTFTIVQEYTSGRLPFFHADLYRVTSPDELEEIGFEEYYQQGGVVIIEWPERLEWIKPSDYLHVNLDIAGSQERIITLNGVGEVYLELVDNLRHAT